MSPNDRFRVRILTALGLGLVACGKEASVRSAPPDASAAAAVPTEAPVPLGPEGTGGQCVPARKDVGTLPSAQFADCAATLQGLCCGSAGGSMPCTKMLLVDVTRTEREKGGRPMCCYEPNARYCEGRPLRAAAGAPAIVARSIATSVIGEARDRDAGERWLRGAAYEHASIASFALTSLQLLALGAPPELVADTHRAALDEIEHTRISLDVAAALLGERHEMGPLDVPSFDRASCSFAEVARTTFRDAACDETLAAIRAAEDAEREDDPATKAARARIAADEARHAELGWRTVAWLLRAGGAAVRAVLSDEIERVRARATHDVAVRDVILPCAQALLDQ